MAICTLIFEDTENGEVTARVELNPPVSTELPCPLLTSAQALGMRVLEEAIAIVAADEQAAT